MKVIIKTTHVTLTPSIGAYVDEKLTKSLGKLFRGERGHEPLLEVEFSRTTKHHKKGKVWYAEANLTLGKTVLRAEALGEDPHEAIDLLEDEILREAKRYKGKSWARARARGRDLKKKMRGM